MQRTQAKHERLRLNTILNKIYIPLAILNNNPIKVAWNGFRCYFLLNGRKWEQGTTNY